MFLAPRIEQEWAMAAERADSAPEGIPSIDRLCRYLSERSPQPMVVVDGRTHVVSYLNPAFAQLVGKEAQELLGRPFTLAVPEGAQNGCLDLLDRVFRTGVAENLAEQEHRQAQVRPVYWSYAVWAIIGADGLPAGVMIQVTDSTVSALFRQQAVAMNEALLVSATRQHELAAEAESLNARLQSSLQSRDHFIAVLSHELRNPLAAFSAGLHLLKLAPQDPVRAANSQDMMERQLTQMVRLVDDLLDVSRITSGKLALRKVNVELAAVLRDAVEASRPQIDKMGHQLTVTLPPEPIVLDADATRLTQVFLNLLNNAAKYSEPGGRIQLAARREGREAAVSIKDTGIGIAAVHLPHVFDVFMQVEPAWKRAQGGLGIGLSLVKEFVELHGGRVTAHSAGPGQGSEFVVRLPVASDAAAAEAPSAPAGNQAAALRRRILVVDDNRDAAEALAMMLRIQGHDVRTAFDGLEGVAAAAAFRPEAILLDLGMPKLDGCAAARRIRAEPWGREPYLVALTGWGADEDRRQARAAGFDVHLTKPVDLDALTKMIAELPRPAP